LPLIPYNPAYAEKVIYYFPQDLNLLGEEKNAPQNLMLALSWYSFQQLPTIKQTSSHPGIRQLEFAVLHL